MLASRTARISDSPSPHGPLWSAASPGVHSTSTSQPLISPPLIHNPADASSQTAIGGRETLALLSSLERVCGCAVFRCAERKTRRLTRECACCGRAVGRSAHGLHPRFLLAPVVGTAATHARCQLTTT